MSTIESTPLHRSLGLTDAEFERIRELLEREPNDFELAVFSLLWSEHCAYKHSRRLLAAFPTTGERVLQGPGENAGVIDVGGRAVPGRGHRRRRHPARHLRDGGAPDRDPRLAPLR
jgi:phosphoribosylformylglycinamidine (FGAM) synthase-like enzyme